MVVKVKEKFEKTRHVRINDKSKIYFLQVRRNVGIYDRLLSNTKKSYNLTNSYNFYITLKISFLKRTISFSIVLAGTFD